MKKRSVTIQDVAEVAGVPVSTVSRVLNGKADVSLATKEHILDVIVELGYTTNLDARSMRRQKNNLLGLVVPAIALPYSVAIISGVEQAIAESEFDLLLYMNGGVDKGDTTAREHHFPSLLNNSLTDGVILVASSAADIPSHEHLVAIDPYVVAEHANYPVVQGSNYQGALDVVEYLVGLGHTRIAFIEGHPEAVSAHRRKLGYKDGLAKAGLPVDAELVVPGDFSDQKAYESSLHVLSLVERPTAIFAANDQSAIGVLNAAQESGLRIPDDLSVVGFDNIPEAEHLGLTTVDQCLSKMGYLATQMLIDLVNDQTLENRIYKMPTKLILRNSCASLSQTENLKT